MTSAPDPYDQTALLLWEALALLLIEEGAVPKERVVETINGVIEVKQELSGSGEAPTIGAATIGLLWGIAGSIAAAPAPGALPRR